MSRNGKITIGNVCFLIDQNQNVLLLKRYFEPMKGLYTGVGGKTNFKEDIYTSCIREIKEETGLTARNLKIRGVIKTVLDDTSWILFVYTGNEYSGELIECPEGELQWISVKNLHKINLIGFIKELIPAVFESESVIEGTLFHDELGNVTHREIKSIE